MRVDFAHIRERGTNGAPIDFAVFDARSNTGFDDDNSVLLARLTYAAQSNGLKVDQSALAYSENGRIRFFGSRPLVEHLSRVGVPRWTHHLDI